MSWLPEDFVHPIRVPVPGTGLHLRPIREADTPLDYPAVMGSQPRLWEVFGPAWDWPKPTLTYDEDRVDLLRHELIMTLEPAPPETIDQIVDEVFLPLVRAASGVLAGT